MSVQSNLERLQEKIQKTAEKSGRDPAAIKLCVVTKMVPVDKIKAVIACGVDIIGENRVREALEKQPQIGRSVQWHMIGHLQSRKAKQAVELFDMVQSVDSVSTAQALEKRCAEAGRSLRILIEVNTSGEEQKYGVSPGEVDGLVREIAPMEHLHIEGLMTMAAFVPDPEMARPSFQQLRQIGEHLRERDIRRARFDVLSMGMTNDFEVAIEEGSTMLRIGTAIFEGT
jgi:pyridoxal phosphate enzyme (YggS family)